MNDIFDHVVDPVSQMQDSFSLAEFLLGEPATADDVSFCDDDVPSIKKEPVVEYAESLGSDDSSRPSPAYSLPYQMPSVYNSTPNNTTPIANVYYHSSPSPEQAASVMCAPGMILPNGYTATRYSPHQAIATSANSYVTSPYYPYYGYHVDQRSRSNFHQLSPDEQEKRKIRRERNKLAALRCRTRRRERIEVLEKETADLEGSNKIVEDEIAALRKEINELQDILVSHNCAMNSKRGGIKEKK